MKKIATLGWTFFWISSVTLGGGMAMLPLMDREFVEKRKWMTAQEMIDVVAVMQSLPGLIVINMAVLIGYRVRGFWGALVASIGAVLTPFAIIAVIARCLTLLSSYPVLDHIFLGVRAGTAALILMSLMKLTKGVLKDSLAWTLAVASFGAAVVLQIDLTLVILFGFAVGVALIVIAAFRRARS